VAAHDGIRKSLAAAVFGLLGSGGLAALVALPAAATFGCGRIGYDLEMLPGEGGSPHEAGAAGSDATTGSGPDAASDGETSTDATAAIEAGNDSPPDAPSAVGPDAPCSPGAVVDYCTSVSALPAPPVIDGVLDCGPALVAITPVGWRGAVAALPPGNSAALAAAWRPDGLYLFVEVTTPTAIAADPAAALYFGAATEIFVDDDGAYAAPPTYDNPGTIQFIVTAPPDGMTPSRRGEGYRNSTPQGAWTSTRFGAFPTPTGFVLEGFLVAADLGLSTWTLAAGANIGLDVAVDVSFTTATMAGAEGYRAGQFFLHVGPTGTPPYQDPSAFCTPMLVP
jgi:hypothetical protein